MTIKKRKAYELEIIDLAFGGRGLAKPDGFPVFIDRCVPGDIVFIKITKKKKSILIIMLFFFIYSIELSTKYGDSTI